MLSLHRSTLCLPSTPPHTLHHTSTCSPSYVQERVLVTLEAAVRAATTTAASTSAAAEALSRKAPHELTELTLLAT